jgi:aldose sugar dehydrogenase
MSKPEDTKENFEKCVCDNCLSYNSCMKGEKEKLYCVRGKGKCDIKKEGCICGSCPVQVENGLGRMYYCLGK